MLENESYLQTGVYLSVQRSNTVTRPSPDTVANTVLVVEVVTISINILIITILIRIVTINSIKILQQILP